MNTQPMKKISHHEEVGEHPVPGCIVKHQVENGEYEIEKGCMEQIMNDNMIKALLMLISKIRNERSIVLPPSEKYIKKNLQ